jgi:LysR family transcriptional regulator of beta-lactamase
LVQPFAIETAAGSYWLTSLLSKRPTAGMQAFKSWLLANVGGGQ